MLNTTIEAVDSLVATAVKNDEWDEAPMVAFVTNDEIKLVVLADGDMYEMLGVLVSAMKSGGIPVSGATGVVMMFEAWGLSGKRLGLDNDQVEELRQELSRAGKRFSDHPGATEIKGFLAIDAEGLESRQITRGEEGVGVKDGAVGGRLVDALRTIFAEASK